MDRLDIFKTLFPRYTAFTLRGAVAGMVVPDEVADYAVGKGLFVMVPAGDGMRLANDPGFRAFAW